MIRSIECTTWPEATFKASWCEEGKKKLLHTHQQYSKIHIELSQLKRKYKQLSNNFNEFKKKNNNNTRDKRSRDPNPNSNKGTTPNGQPPNKKAKAPVCKHCMAAGLGKRPHKSEDCNPYYVKKR